MTPHSTERFVDDVLDVTWPVLALSLLSAVAMVLPSGSSLRLLAVLAAVLLFPGYALSLAVFPVVASESRGVRGFLPTTSDWRLAGLRPHERWALGFGFSVGLMPVYGFFLAAAGLSYDVGPVLATVLLFAVTFALAALGRRRRLPANPDVAVPGVPTLSWLASTVTDSTGGLSRSNAVVVLALFVAVATLAAGVAMPADGTQYTTAALYTERDNGTLVAGGYPRDLDPDESASLVLVLTNHEGESVDYHVVVQSQQVAPDGTVTKQRHLNEFAVTLGDRETWERPHRVASLLDGDRVRITYLVYRGDPPANPTMGNAYRSLTLWVSEPPSGASSQTAAQTDGRTDETVIDG